MCSRNALVKKTYKMILNLTEKIRHKARELWRGNRQDMLNLFIRHWNVPCNYDLKSCLYFTKVNHFIFRMVTLFSQSKKHAVIRLTFKTITLHGRFFFSFSNIFFPSSSSCNFILSRRRWIEFYFLHFCTILAVH